ncbi:hypothetical protein CASFOL_035416 [Castilleja foliolosa]|uniref:F-box domain-containing protein n=1 Tax=Castilleja foliolosa TaxID=1961234 RepID=A0ABD3BT98_9LAMI
MTSPNNRIKEMLIDRISALPDCLIIHILSFLEVKQSAITTLLSKRWQFLWTQSPRLIFSEKYIPEDAGIQNFVSRVNRTLVIYGRNDLDTFKVKFPYGESNSPDVTAWVGFVLKNKAKQVSLLLNDDYAYYYRLPQTMFQSAYLKRLKLRGCIVAPWGTIEWPSLTDLRIKKSELQQHVVEKMLSGCPVLRCLVLKRCWGFNRLDVSSKSLYELRVSDPEGPDEDDIELEPFLQISAPYLHTLWVSLDPCCRKLSLENTSSLVRATIDIVGIDWNDAKIMSHAKEILKKIRHVKVVDLRFGYIEVLCCLPINRCRFPQSARTCLSVEASTVECSIHVLVALLKSSPNLEALVIQGSTTTGEHPHNCKDLKIALDCDLLHLKSIVIKDFIDPTLDGEPMLTLARILLNKAPALEKMVVPSKIYTCRSKPDVIDSLKIEQALLSYPRSSKAVVSFSTDVHLLP